jgi:hypothetical protein
MTKLTIFLFGLTLGMWGDAALVELENASVWRLLSPPTIDFNHEFIEDALEPVVEKQRPAPTWFYVKTPARKLA